MRIPLPGSGRVAGWPCWGTCSSSARTGATITSRSEQLAQQAGVELLVTVGPEAAAISERFAGDTEVLPGADDAARIVPGLLRPGDLVLVKGSLGVGLKAVCTALGVGATPAQAGDRV